MKESMSFGRSIRNSGSVILVIIVIIYIAYFTKEVCIRYQNIQKYERLKTYESEIDDLTKKLNSFRSEAKVVKHSLGLLKEIMGHIISKTKETVRETSVLKAIEKVQVEDNEVR